MDPIFPPGDSPEINDQDAFYRRRVGGPSGPAARNAPQRGPLLRVESNDAVAGVVDANDGVVPADEETRGTTFATRPTSTPTPNPDPLGFQDFVSSLTRDLQVLAGGSSGSSWQQGGSPLSNFHNGNGLFYPPSGASALGLQGGAGVLPQATNNAGWLQSILGKRK